MTVVARLDLPTTDPATLPEFVTQVDLAGRLMGSTVIAANDESFAERENLIMPAAPVFATATFGNKGQIYDGWETRRRRSPGQDWAIVRLGVPGVVSGVVIDTSFFTGNYTPQVSVQAASLPGYPSVEEAAAAQWTELLAPSPAAGDALNYFPVEDPRRWTHVRLTMHPDGGVARFRVHGEVVPDPGLLSHLPVDLAALENGGRVTSCSNMFYSSPSNLIAPYEARTMGEGWETARRRDTGNDWVEFTLAGSGQVSLIEVDTRHFVHNAPGWVSVLGYRGDEEIPLLRRMRVQPDTRHRFPLPEAASRRTLDRVHLDVHPDGGMARLRLWGTLSDEGLAAMRERWDATQ